MEIILLRKKLLIIHVELYTHRVTIIKLVLRKQQGQVLQTLALFVKFDKNIHVNCTCVDLHVSRILINGLPINTLYC